MLFSIPILVQEQPAGDAKLSTFVVRPLFQPTLVERADRLSRAQNKLTSALQEVLTQLGREPRHEALAEWTFHPALEETTLDLRLELNSGCPKCRLHFVGYPALGRKLYFTPAAPDFHFEVLAGQSLADRATAALTRHFREQEKQGTFDLECLTQRGKARLTVLEIELDPAALAKAPKKSTRAMIFGGPEKMDGADELRKTGRPLHLSYPDDLERAVGREREVSELARLLASSDRRPMVLVGPRKVGKTALIHELVWRICERKKEHYGGGREVWLLSPQRLISGMSYLGEWENRVLAIVEHARAKDKVLYFDDLLGLFTAGLSSASDLSVAQVFKPVLEKRHLRVLAEITPEAWRVLRERDRAFADLFQVIPVEETTEPETWRVLISIARFLEVRLPCEFSIEVVPAVFDLFRRFGGDAAFPGKAVGFLRQLAIRSNRASFDEDAVFSAFQEQTGLHPAFLHPRDAMRRQTILEALRLQVVGQDHALEAFADVLLKLQARLNDTRRPLGSFLLLGPTGVGKTEAAKAVARFLFGHEDRLLRFDMNEYVDAAAVARLAGTADAPEGLLTSAIRRQPFSVLLFDEIEKAAPEVFDLLLAVLDEGRLADALGRVADFTHTIIFLTSNLGARETGARLGFGANTAADQEAVFVGIAEKFFRPEFFNRLDRVIPFRALAPTELAGIARRLLAGVCARDGLRQRDCLVQVLPSAVGRLVELGYHPQLGARALKRVIERELALPLAQRLAALPSNASSLATLEVVEGRFLLHLEKLSPVPQTIFWGQAAAKPRSKIAQRAWVEGLLVDLEAFLERVDTALEKSAPSGPLQVGQVPVEVTRYSLCREQWLNVERLAKTVARSVEPTMHGIELPTLPQPRPTKVVVRQYITGANPSIDRAREAVALRLEMAELDAAASTEIPDSPVTALLREAAWLEAMTASPAADQPFALVFRALSELDADALAGLTRLYRHGLATLWASSDAAELLEESLPPMVVHPLPTPTTALWCQGRNLRRVLPVTPAIVWVRRADGTLGGILMAVALANSALEMRAMVTVEAGRAKPERPGPPALGPIVHLWASDGRLTDFRNGLAVRGSTSVDETRAFLLSALPLPAELKF